MTSTTFLSKYVFNIIVELGKKQSNCTHQYISPCLTYDWKNIEKVFGDTADDFNILEQPESWFETNVQLVWEVVHAAGSAVQKASRSQREEMYQLGQWIHCKHNMAEYLSWSERDTDVGSLLAVLHLTATLERALGDLYLTKNQPVPFLLRDLLKTSELKTIFGKIPIVFTQLLLGSPKGINLRNVVWHGFVSPGELHPHLVSGLVVLIASLGQQMPSQQEILRRPQFESFGKFHDKLGGVFPDITGRHEEVWAILETSPVISENRRIYWRRAYEFFENDRFDDSLVLLMPHLEHCLRVLYCRVNDCPARLLTAESTVLYTTLDEILAPAPRPVVGEGLLMLLLDLTSSLSGPRLRDRLSHDECDLSSLPRWLANLVLCVGLSIAHYKEDQCCCGALLCAELQASCAQYRSRFHVVASLREDTETLLAQWQGWENCPQPPDLTVAPCCCPHISALSHLLFPQATAVVERLPRVMNCLRKGNPPTLYRGRTELELAASLVGVVGCVAQTAGKIQHAACSHYEAWCSRSLRSRARSTCQRMWAVLPDLWTALLCVVMVTTLCYQALPTLAQQGKTALRMVKTLRKAVENTVSLCDADRNRWTEAHNMLSALATSVTVWLGDNQHLLPPIN